MSETKMKAVVYLCAAFVLTFAGLLIVPGIALARGGEGIGITAEADSVAGSSPDTTTAGWGDPNFVRFEPDDDRIGQDINFLVSESFSGWLELLPGEKNGFLQAVDDSINNEYDFQIHDFGLTFNYFACPDTAYGEYQGDYNVLFKLGPQSPSDPNYYGVPERNHLDYCSAPLKARHLFPVFGLGFSWVRPPAPPRGLSDTPRGTPPGSCTRAPSDSSARCRTEWPA